MVVLGFNSPSRQYFRLYRAVSHRGTIYLSIGFLTLPGTRGTKRQRRCDRFSFFSSRIALDEALVNFDLCFALRHRAGKGVN